MIEVPDTPALAAQEPGLVTRRDMRLRLWVSCCPGDGGRRILFRSTVKGDEQVTSKKIVAPAYVAAMARAEADPASARFWVGLDIGFKRTAVCVVVVDGAVVHQVSMKSHATEISRYLRRNFKSHVTLIGMETGGLSPHLAGKLREQGFQVAVLDALQVHRVLSMKHNNTDANDARGIAEITRSAPRLFDRGLRQVEPVLRGSGAADHARPAGQAAP